MQVRRSALVGQRQRRSQHHHRIVGGADVHRRPVLAGDLELVFARLQGQVRAVQRRALERQLVGGAPAVEGAAQKHGRAGEGFGASHPQRHAALAVVAREVASGGQCEEVVAGFGNGDHEVRPARPGKRNRGAKGHWHGGRAEAATGGVSAQVHRVPIIGGDLELVLPGFHADGGAVHARSGIGHRIVRAPAVEGAAHEGLRRQGAGVRHREDGGGAVQGIQGEAVLAAGRDGHCEVGISPRRGQGGGNAERDGRAAFRGADVHRAPVFAGDLELVVAGVELHIAFVLAAAHIAQRIRAPAVELAAQKNGRVAVGHRRLETGSDESGQARALRVALGFCENRRGAPRHSERAPGVAIALHEGRAAHGLVGGFPLRRMQGEAGGRADLDRALLGGAVGDHHDGVAGGVQVRARRVFGVGDRAGAVVDAHGDQVRQRAAADVVEAHAIHHLGGAGEAEQRAALGDGEELAEHRRGGGDVRGRGFGVRVRDGGQHLLVPRALRRQTDVPIVGGAGEVDVVEPVAGVVAVLAQGFGAQQIRAHVNERHALAEQHQRLRLRRHADALGAARLGATGDHAAAVQLIPKRHAVVNRGVVHALLGIRRVAAVARRLHRDAGIQHQLELGQVAGQAGAHAREIAAGGDGEVAQPVAHAIVEGADAGAGQVRLRGQLDPVRRAAGARRPPFAVDVSV